MINIYKSSAGSGKTFTLVKEYLKLCLRKPERFRYIVAITFTNASAAEMKDRVLKALKDLSEGGASALRNQLLEEGMSPADLANAPLLLEKILYNYALFNISTIDSFFHRIVRSFNKELDIPSDFEIYIDTDEALDYAVDNFLQQSRELPEIHKLLVDFIREKISNSQSWNISADLYRIAKELLKDNSLEIPHVELSDIQEYILTLKKILQEFETEMDRLARTILKNTADFGLEIEDFKYGNSGVFSFIRKSLKENRDYSPGKRFISGLTDDKEWFSKSSPNARLIEDAVNSSLLPDSVQLYETYLAGIQKYNSAREILKNIYTFSVYEELNKMLNAYRLEKNALLIADFTRILAGRIANEEISFVYSKIGNRYDHYLIDEFQDTSVLQWLSLKPLIENAVSQGSGCLLVGDSKQAIYRWRGGSVELIEKQVIEIDFPAHSQKHHLNRNFRSRTQIVDFNNLFFRSVSGLFSGNAVEYALMQQIFEDANQISPESNGEPGYAEINFIAKEYREPELYAEQVRDLMLRQINQCLNDGYSLKDICILVRDRKDTEEVSDMLHQAQIAFITQDTLKLDHSPTVRFLLSLLNYIYDPSNELSKYEVLSLYVQYFSNMSGEEIAYVTDGIALPGDFITGLSKFSFMQVYEITEELINIFSLNIPDAYLQRFQDAVLEFSLKEKGGIKTFLEWWEKGKFTVVLPENQDAIRIMTIHKSKGLEFPVVIMPFADWDFNSGKPNIIWVNPGQEPFDRLRSLPVNFGPGLKDSIFADDFEKEEALTAIDNLNLLYVAFTRAKHRLYISTTQVKKQPENGIKNIPALITSVLNPAFDSSITRIVYGTESEEVSTKQAAHTESRYLESYPVYSRM